MQCVNICMIACQHARGFTTGEEVCVLHDIVSKLEFSIFSRN